MAFALWMLVRAISRPLNDVVDVLEGVAQGDRSRRLSIERIVDLIAEAPARRFRIAGKGTLTVGADADLTLVDPAALVVPEPPRREKTRGKPCFPYSAHSESNLI